MKPAGKKALLVVDMQRDFMETGGALYCGDEARKIIPRVQQLINQMRRDGALIIYTRDTHTPNDPEFAVWPEHCVRGTRGHELLPELEVHGHDRVIEKSRYSAFFETNLHALLQKENVGEIHLVGDCTSICVLFTAADARNHHYPVVIHRDAVTDFDPQAHTFALKHMEKVLKAKVL